jgi:hypothetical protein
MIARVPVATVKGISGMRCPISVASVTITALRIKLFCSTGCRCSSSSRIKAGANDRVGLPEISESALRADDHTESACGASAQDLNAAKTIERSQMSSTIAFSFSPKAAYSARRGLSSASNIPSSIRRLAPSPPSTYAARVTAGRHRQASRCEPGYHPHLPWYNV